MPATIQFQDQVALITGSVHGIGRAIAKLFIDCGARVVVNDINEQETIKTATELGDFATGICADISNENEVRSLIKQVCEIRGGIDIIVNNAAVTAPVCRTVDQMTADWQQVIDVNLRGAYLVCREGGRLMCEQRHGVIVNVSSLAGLVPMPASNDYGVSKAAVIMLTKTLAAEWGRLGIRVNAVAPGFTEAPMMERMLTTTNIKREDYLKRIPMGRFAEPEEIAQTVVFLASDQASYINGAVLPVDGGWAANCGP